MNKIIRSGLLCPLRIKEKNLEVLLTRRAFWNGKKKRPMSYPGEWLFAGGQFQMDDRDLLETAEREFREELRYKGSIMDLHLLRSAVEFRDNKGYYMEFFSAKIDPEEGFMFDGRTGEVIDVAWFRPMQFIDKLYSPEFSRTQKREFEKLAMDYPAFGFYALNGREVPKQNIKTLEFIKELYEAGGLS